jgi:biotin-(acetyl-CoA carboxylase) ligase
LLKERKVAGVLLDVAWIDQHIDSLVLGIGVNVYAESVPPEDAVDYPTTSVEQAVGFRPSREDLLLQIVERIGLLSQPLNAEAVLDGVNQRLAFRGRPVEVGTGEADVQGILVALGEEGEIVLRTEGQGEMRLSGADPHLRPLDGLRE